MKKFLRKIYQKILYGKRCDSNTYIKFLRKKGVRIGDDTIIYEPKSVVIDDTRPWLIEIGSKVKITHGVVILTHGFDWSVLKTKFNTIMGSSGKVKIGDNVFIGMNTTILKGVTIGDNVIIGANSLINKDIPSNVVVAGNPCRVICSIDEYLEKRKKEQLKEAVELTTEYFLVYKRWPEKRVLREFIFAFENRDTLSKEDSIFNEIASINDNFDLTFKEFKNSNGEFNSYEEFLNYCKHHLKETKEKR